MTSTRFTDLPCQHLDPRRRLIHREYLVRRGSRIYLVRWSRGGPKVIRVYADLSEYTLAAVSRVLALAKTKPSRAGRGRLLRTRVRGAARRHHP